MNKQTAIDYQLVRSKRKTANIIIERDGSLLVRVPEDTSAEKVEDIIESKKLWIYKNLAEWRDLNATRVIREYRNGEGFLYLGRSYRLSLVNDQEQDLLLKHGRFCLKRSLVDMGDPGLVQAAFRNYFIHQGTQRITERIDLYTKMVGAAPKKIEVKELGHRWGSCSPEGNLTFHWKCMMAPLSIIDYIVVHELCHIHHLDHTEAFWNEVDKIMPNYLERKEWLKANGAAMDV